MHKAQNARDPVNERLVIVDWLRRRAQEDEIAGWIMGKPHWKALPWALLHPFKFGKAYGRLFALSLAADEVERGAHLLNQESDNG